MIIKPTFFGLIILLMGQLGAGIWWASSLSSEVERLAGVQGTAIPSLKEAIKDLDVMRFQSESISNELERIRSANTDIANQHSRLFDILRNQGSSGPVEQKGYGYD